jgi:hypothetical protein
MHSIFMSCQQTATCRQGKLKPTRVERLTIVIDYLLALFRILTCHVSAFVRTVTTLAILSCAVRVRLALSLCCTISCQHGCAIIDGRSTTRGHVRFNIYDRLLLESTLAMSLLMTILLLMVPVTTTTRSILTATSTKAAAIGVALTMIIKEGLLARVSEV